MSKFLGRVQVPLEVLWQTENTKLRKMLLLPRSVRVVRVYTSHETMTRNAIIESDEPVEGFTFLTEPGCYIPSCSWEVYLNRYIKVRV